MLGLPGAGPGPAQPPDWRVRTGVGWGAGGGVGRGVARGVGAGVDGGWLALDGWSGAGAG